MACDEYHDKHNLFTRTMCINQLIRPKEEIPKHMRPKGMGNCVKCKTCYKNFTCTGYSPVSLMPVYTEEENEQKFKTISKDGKNNSALTNKGTSTSSKKNDT